MSLKRGRGTEVTTDTQSSPFLISRYISKVNPIFREQFVPIKLATHGWAYTAKQK